MAAKKTPKKPATKSQDRPASKASKPPAGRKPRASQGAAPAPPRLLRVPASPDAEAGTTTPKSGGSNASTPSTKKLSALDAAAQVLADSAEPMNCKEMIDVMAAQGLWTSPGGKTPASTLYSALLKEIVTKDKDSRFRKVSRGQFART